jgi:hypothetical protein
VSKPLRLAPGPVDDALDGLVATVDGLVRDLAEPEGKQPSGRASRGLVGATLREKGVACVVVVAVLAVELMVVSWLVSNM